jgi:hypothetical protein
MVAFPATLIAREGMSLELLPWIILTLRSLDLDKRSCCDRPWLQFILQFVKKLNLD